MLNYSDLKKRAYKATKNRSLRPDAQYIFAAFLLSLTILGLPIAYAIIKEYHKYLKNCLYEYNTNGVAEKGKIYDRTPLTSILFDYKISYAWLAIKAIWSIVSTKSTFFYFTHLNDEQNKNVKMNLEQIKMYFPEIYAFEGVAVLAPIAALLIGGSNAFLCFLAVDLILAIIMLKPFVCYCQAYVMYEKVCFEMKRDTDADEAQMMSDN